jgi:hypothetical protein
MTGQATARHLSSFPLDIRRRNGRNLARLQPKAKHVANVDEPAGVGGWRFGFGSNQDVVRSFPKSSSGTRSSDCVAPPARQIREGVHPHADVLLQGDIATERGMFHGSECPDDARTQFGRETSQRMSKSRVHFFRASFNNTNRIHAAADRPAASAARWIAAYRQTTGAINA